MEFIQLSNGFCYPCWLKKVGKSRNRKVGISRFLLYSGDGTRNIFPLKLRLLLGYCSIRWGCLGYSVQGLCSSEIQGNIVSEGFLASYGFEGKTGERCHAVFEGILFLRWMMTLLWWLLNAFFGYFFSLIKPVLLNASPGVFLRYITLLFLFQYVTHNILYARRSSPDQQEVSPSVECTQRSHKWPN